MKYYWQLIVEFLSSSKMGVWKQSFVMLSFILCLAWSSSRRIEIVVRLGFSGAIFDSWFRRM